MITAQNKVADVLKISDKIVDLFKEMKLECLTCKGISEDTIYHVAENNGLKVDEFIKKLNSVV
jgi:hypothetical protein